MTNHVKMIESLTRNRRKNIGNDATIKKCQPLADTFFIFLPVCSAAIKHRCVAVRSSTNLCSAFSTLYYLFMVPLTMNGASQRMLHLIENACNIILLPYSGPVFWFLIHLLIFTHIKRFIKRVEVRERAVHPVHFG